MLREETKQYERWGADFLIIKIGTTQSILAKTSPGTTLVIFLKACSSRMINDSLMHTAAMFYLVSHSSFCCA